MKKFISLLLIVLLFITACGGGGAAKGPEGTVDKFFKEAKNFDLKKMAEYLYDEDGTGMDAFGDPDAVDEDPMSRIMQDYVKIAAKKLNYKILDTKEDGDRATVSVEAEYAVSTDFAASLLDNMLEIFMSEEDIDIEDPEFYEELKDRVDLSAPTETQKGTFELQLIEDGGDWLIEDFDDDFMDVIMAGVMSAIDAHE